MGFVLGRDAINIIHAKGVAAGQNDCLHHDPGQHRDLPAGKPLSASDGNPWRPCISLLRWEHVVGHSRRANPGYLSRVPTEIFLGESGPHRALRSEVRGGVSHTGKGGLVWGTGWCQFEIVKNDCNGRFDCLTLQPKVHRPSRPAFAFFASSA